MFASLTAIVLFIALAWLEKSFLNRIMEAALQPPDQSITDHPHPPAPNVSAAHPLTQDS